MPADIIQVEYDTLEEILKKFDFLSTDSREMTQRLSNIVAKLQNGGWQGRGSQTFLAEMNDTLFPALQRLSEALEESRETIYQISNIMYAAEEEAAQLFQVVAGTDPGVGANGSGDTTADGDHSGLTPGRDLVVKDPGEIFSEQYMENFIGSHYQGENSPELNRLMEELLKNGPAPEAEVSNLLDRIADMRGVDRQAFRQDYQTYLNLWENASSKGNIDLSRHGDFLGSTVSLRYGAVIGDVFGVDPVFGALLNPTGGLVGPGDNAYQPGINDAIGYHGVFHDAGGYLLNIQGGIGPGYDYLGRDLLPTTSPVSGQVGGISFWASHPQLDVDILPNIMPDIPYVPEFVERGIGNYLENDIITNMRQGIYVIEGGADVVSGVGSLVSGNFSTGLDKMSDGVDTLLGGMSRTVSERLFGVFY